MCKGKSMEKNLIEKIIYDLYESFPGNRVEEELALSPEAAGIRFFEKPLVGIGAADDPLFEKLRSEEVVVSWYMMPEEWLCGAKSVISMFFPFTEEVRKANGQCREMPAHAWLHGRIEGQNYLEELLEEFCRKLNELGLRTCLPTTDNRLRAVMDGVRSGSNWSERHTAYICGLGTFGMSNGLITEKGIAGRFISVITDGDIPADTRPYTEIFEYCNGCGACIRRCPAGSITREGGNGKKKCSEHNDKVYDKYYPRYGCGLCQTRVPCESRIPPKINR